MNKNNKSDNNTRGSSSSRFAPAAYKRIISDIKTSNQNTKLSALETLAETLAFAEPSQLKNFPTAETSREIIKIFQNSTDNLILTLTTQCIVNLLDAIPDSQRSIGSSNFVQISKEKIMDSNLVLNKSITENVIHTLCALTKFRAKEIGQSVGVKFVLDHLEEISAVERHYAVTALARFTSYYVVPKFAKSLPVIAGYFASNDEIVAHNMIDTFTNIFNSVNFSDVPLEVAEVISMGAPCIRNPEILLRVIDLLQRLVYNKKFAEAVIDSSFNFEQILMENDYGVDFSKIRRQCLLLIRSFLPVPDFPIGFWESDRAVPDNAEKFSSYIQPLLIELALEKMGDMDIIFVCLAMSLQLAPRDVPSQLFTLMIVTSQDPKIAPFVILLALNVADKPTMCSSGLVSQLTLIKPKNDFIDSWYQQKLTVLKSFSANPTSDRPRPNSFKKFREIFDFINKTDLSSFELHASGYLSRFLELMRPEKDLSDLDFSRIADRLHQLITYTNIPELLDPFESMSTHDLAIGSIIVDIKYNNKSFKHKKFENTSLMIAIEAWYNETILHVTTNDLLNAARHTGRIGQLISLENAGSISYTHVGLFHRAFNTKRYRRFSFKMDGKIYSASEFLFQSIARNLPTPEYWPLIVPEIELIPEETSVISKIDVPYDKIPLKPIFELLQMIHRIQPTLDLCCPEFEKALHPHLMSYFLNVGLFSPAIQIAAHYPFLFSFEFRTFVFRMISSDFYSSLAFAQKHIFDNTEKLREGRMYSICTIHRNSLFEDGFLLMNKIACGPLQFDISFDGEAGFGIGPTKEFLSLFAEDLTRKKHNMWRTDDSSSEFSWTKIGLFPSCEADPEYFYVLGILCAKAVNMNTVLPIPLSVEFFKLIRGDTLKLENVDSEYAKSLEDREGLLGLTFVLPGSNSDIELIPNGANIEVTRENVDRFIELIKDFVFGSKLDMLRQRFCDGFATVFQKGIWNILEAREWRRLIAGEDVSITLKDLNRYVEISHGYEKDSPQISMLFEVLTEFDNSQKSLFVKFITGSERLPVGGLASLQPQLAIAKRVDDSIPNPDDSLPSVMTCTNYFKLPPYSSKEMMKEKIIKAITEGQGAFLLT